MAEARSQVRTVTAEAALIFQPIAGLGHGLPNECLALIHCASRVCLAHAHSMPSCDSADAWLTPARVLVLTARLHSVKKTFLPRMSSSMRPEIQNKFPQGRPGDRFVELPKYM